MLERQHGLEFDWWDCGDKGHASGSLGSRVGASGVGGAGQEGGGEDDGQEGGGKDDDGVEGTGSDGGRAQAWQRLMTVSGVGFRVWATRAWATRVLRVSGLRVGRLSVERLRFRAWRKKRGDACVLFNG